MVTNKTTSSVTVHLPWVVTQLQVSVEIKTSDNYEKTMSEGKLMKQYSGKFEKKKKLSHSI